MQGMEFLIGFAIVALIVTGIWLAHAYEKKRREEFEALARELGWRFEAEGSDTADMACFEHFARGHSQRALATLHGEVTIGQERWPAQAGDYTYKVTSGAGKNRRTTTYRFTYVIVRTPFARLPDLVVRPEGLFDKLAGVFGFDDIDFESEEFSRKYHVKSADKRFAYDVLHPRMLQMLLASKPHEIALATGRCLYYDGTRRWKAEEVREALRFLDRFFELWPEHLVRELRSRT